MPDVAKENSGLKVLVLTINDLYLSFKWIKPDYKVLCIYSNKSYLN